MEERLYYVSNLDETHDVIREMDTMNLRVGQMYVFRKTQRRQRLYTSFDSPIPINTLPRSAEYSSVRRGYNNEVILEGSASTIVTTPPHMHPTFQSYIDSLPRETQAILEHTIFPDDGRIIAQTITNSDCIAVTDASYEEKTNVGAAAWILVGQNDYDRCEGRIGQPKTDTKTDSYRAESLGIQAIYTAIEHLCLYHQIQTGRITIAWDNDASLMMGVDNEDRLDIRSKYYDIFWAIDEIKDRLTIETVSKKVKGHRDREVPRHQLTRIERLNCYVDDESKKYRLWLENEMEYNAPMDFGDKNWSIWINGEKVIKNVRHRLEDHIQGRTIKAHISRTDAIPLSVVEKIDWENILHASKLLTINRKIWLVKHVSGFTATASKMMYRQEWDTDLCPLCECARETTSHHSVCRNKEITD